MGVCLLIGVITRLWEEGDYHLMTCLILKMTPIRGVVQKGGADPNVAFVATSG